MSTPPQDSPIQAPESAGLPGGLSGRDIALVASFAALMGVLGQLPAFQLAISSVPITAQTLGVMLTGLLIGPRLGFLAMLTFQVLVAVGLPLLPVSGTRPRGGLGAFTSASGGFILSWLVAVVVIGLLIRIFLARGHNMLALGAAVSAFLGGVVVVYAIGVPWMMLVAGMDINAGIAVMLSFLPGDMVKVGVAAAVAAGVHRGYPRLSELFLPKTSAVSGS